MLRAVWHLITAAQFFFALWYNATFVIYPPSIKRPPCCGKWKYLTVWNCFVQAIFFTICLVNDLFGSNEVTPKKTPLFRKIKDFVHASIAFPLAVFVTLTFWGLMAVDRELVFPKALDPYFPVWLNHILHTNITIFTLVELYTSFRVYPSRKKGLLTLTSFMLVYLSWTLFLFGKTGRWVYPVMEVLNWPQRIAFMLSLLIFTLSLYIAGEFLNKLIWRKELTLVGTPKKSSKAKSR